MVKKRKDKDCRCRKFTRFTDLGKTLFIFFLSTVIPANVYGDNAKMSIFLKNLDQAIATLSEEIREQKETRLKTSKPKHTPLKLQQFYTTEKRTSRKTDDYV